MVQWWCCCLKILSSIQMQGKFHKTFLYIRRTKYAECIISFVFVPYLITGNKSNSFIIAVILKLLLTWLLRMVGLLDGMWATNKKGVVSIAYYSETFRYVPLQTEYGKVSTVICGRQRWWRWVDFADSSRNSDGVWKYDKVKTAKRKRRFPVHREKERDRGRIKWRLLKV